MSITDMSNIFLSERTCKYVVGYSQKHPDDVLVVHVTSKYNPETNQTEEKVFVYLKCGVCRLNLNYRKDSKFWVLDFENPTYFKTTNDALRALETWAEEDPETYRDHYDFMFLSGAIW